MCSVSETIKQSWCGTRAHDENSRTFSAQVPESRRRFRKISNAGEAFLIIRRLPVTNISQSTQYILVILCTEPDLELRQHLVEGRIVSVNAVVRFQSQLHLS